MITISLCLSDIPKEKIKSANNGKKYVNLVLFERKDIGQYGETHTLAVSNSKDEREAKCATVFIGSGKYYGNKSASPTIEEIEEMPSADILDGDLPF